MVQFWFPMQFGFLSQRWCWHLLILNVGFCLSWELQPLCIHKSSLCLKISHMPRPLFTLFLAQWAHFSQTQKSKHHSSRFTLITHNWIFWCSSFYLPQSQNISRECLSRQHSICSWCTGLHYAAVLGRMTPDILLIESAAYCPTSRKISTNDLPISSRQSVIRGSLVVRWQPLDQKT